MLSPFLPHLWQVAHASSRVPPQRLNLRRLGIDGILTCVELEAGGACFTF
jgi:hypothetical protein